jgi:simple sugar transport system permease protein
MANTLKGLIVFFVAVPLISKEVIGYFNKTKDDSFRFSDIRRFVNNLILKYKRILLFIVSTIGLIIVLLLQMTLDSVISSLGAQFDFKLLEIDLFLLLSLIISISIFIITILAYNYVKVRRGVSHTRYLYFLLFTMTGITIFTKSIDRFGQDLTLFGLILAVFCFILSQEYLARRNLVDSSKEEPVTKLESDKIEIKRRNIQIYAVSAILCLIGTIVIIFINFEPNLNNIPINIDLFFFILDTLGKFIGLIGSLVILGSVFLLGRIEIPRNHYIKYTFYFSAIFFEFIAIATIFTLDPILLFTMTLPIATPIGLAALGGMFSEKSGVVNIGLEGMMLTGAFVAVWISELTGDPWAGVFGAIIAGALMGLLHAIASIRFRADQVVVGVAINMLASALTTLGIIAVWNVRGTSPNVEGLDNITFEILVDIGTFISDFFKIDIFRGTAVILYELLGGSSGYSPLVYLFIVLIFVTWWIIQRTSFGLRVRAVGEHPRAADTLGVNVYKMRYICVILSGVLAALGGAQLTVGFVPIFGRNMTTGRGFVALAALIFGGWSPIGAALASFLFAFAYAFRYQLESLGIEWLLPIQGLDAGGLFIQNLTPTIPFLVTIIVVAAVAKKMRPPAADGIPYIKEG